MIQNYTKLILYILYKTIFILPANFCAHLHLSWNHNFATCELSGVNLTFYVCLSTA